MIARVAQFKFKNQDDMSLLSKLEHVLPVILAVVGQEMVDADPNVDEESESCDEY